ncbi:MAG: hypothetical protein GX456_11015 [Verrucomicrobia bacterium]|nr:hypothetical protein [Verrucomicrobiota bacterium]
MTDRAPASITQTRRPIFDRLGAAKNRRAPIEALETATASGARPSSAASTRWPIVHLLRSRKSDARSLTGWGRRKIAALLSTRWKQQRRRERGLPRPHQSDDRSYDRFQSRKSGART